MAHEKEPAAARNRTKHRRKLPCANHPRNPAAARCEVCGNPICRECVQFYDGAHICGELCWNKKRLDESAKASKEDRLRRRQKEKKANRAVTVGLLAALVVVLGAVGAFVYTVVSDHSGDKAWEFENPGGSFDYAVRPNLNSVFLLSADGNVETIDALTGVLKWRVKLPERSGHSELMIIDEDHCLVYFGNTVLLCKSGRAAPAWEFSAPQPFLCAEPVHLDDRLYAVSSPVGSFFQVFPELEEMRSALLMSPELESLRSVVRAPRPQSDSAGAIPPPREQPETAGEQAEVERLSTVSAVDMASGKGLWDTELVGLRVEGLLADESRVYAVGYQWREYGRYGAAPEPEEPKQEDSAGDQEASHVSSTQLWALNATTGEPEWKLEGMGNFLVSPMKSDEGIVFSTMENIYLISPEGKIKWKYSLGERGVYAFQPSYDKLFVSTGDGFLVCIDLASGREKWTTEVGMGADRIVVSSPLAYVSSLVKVEKEARRVIMTKRWKGSEDLLKKALKRDEVSYERVIHGIDVESGETRWSIPKIEGEFEYGRGFLYALRYFERLQLLDASVDSSQIAKTVSNLGAYDCLTGEKVWETGIDGYASDLRLTPFVGIVKSRSQVLTVGAAAEQRPGRLIGISLE